MRDLVYESVFTDMVFERAKALKQDILDFRSLHENELSYWSISFKDYGLALIGKQ